MSNSVGSPTYLISAALLSPVENPPAAFSCRSGDSSSRWARSMSFEPGVAVRALLNGSPLSFELGLEVRINGSSCELPFS